MEQLLHKQTVSVTQTVLNTAEEYVISGDYILPEYCPDVAVVLKCLVTPHIQSRRWSGDALTLDGMAVIRVLYLDEERRCVRVAEFTQPINCTMRGQGGDTVPVRVSVTQDYVNCRAVSPRRVEVRGGLTVRVVAQCAAPLELPCAAAAQRLYTKSVSRTVSAPLTSGEKIIAVNETLVFDSSLPPAEQLLGGDCAAVVSEVKLLTDKAIIKGQIHLHQLYTDDSVAGTTYVLEQSVPFSAIMDVDGVRDGMLHTAHVCVLSDTEECVVGENGQNTALGFSAKLLIQLYTYERVSAELVLDAYHPAYPVTLDAQPLSLHSLCGAFRQTVTAQKSIPLPCEGLQELLDVWVTPMQTVGRVDGGRVELDVALLVSLLVRDADGIIAYYERPEDVHLDCAQVTDGGPCEVLATVTPVGVSYAAMGDKLDLRLTLAVAAELWESAQDQVVRDITLHQDSPYPSESAVLRLYYADAGESVWDIARRCHTSPDAVREENDLRDEVLLAKTVLLIPAN